MGKWNGTSAPSFDLAMQRQCSSRAHVRARAAAPAPAMPLLDPSPTLTMTLGPEDAGGLLGWIARLILWIPVWMSGMKQEESRRSPEYGHGKSGRVREESGGSPEEAQNGTGAGCPMTRAGALGRRSWAGRVTPTGCGSSREGLASVRDPRPQLIGYSIPHTLGLESVIPRIPGFPGSNMASNAGSRTPGPPRASPIVFPAHARGSSGASPRLSQAIRDAVDAARLRNRGY
eukprot:gene16900-biopygen11900